MARTVTTLPFYGLRTQKTLSWTAPAWNSWRMYTIYWKSLWLWRFVGFKVFIFRNLIFRSHFKGTVNFDTMLFSLSCTKTRVSWGWCWMTRLRVSGCSSWLRFDVETPHFERNSSCRSWNVQTRCHNSALEHMFHGTLKVCIAEQNHPHINRHIQRTLWQMATCILTYHPPLHLKLLPTPSVPLDRSLWLLGLASQRFN
jgi:hypothetical protein